MFNNPPETSSLSTERLAHLNHLILSIINNKKDYKDIKIEIDWKKMDDQYFPTLNFKIEY